MKFLFCSTDVKVALVVRCKSQIGRVRLTSFGVRICSAAPTCR